MNISSIRPPLPPDLVPSGPIAEKNGDFTKVLQSAIGNVQAAQNDAAASIGRFLNGEGDELHSTILTAQRAELEFDLLMQVRNKVVSAYDEVMKMQL